MHLRSVATALFGVSLFAIQIGTAHAADAIDARAEVAAAVYAAYETSEAIEKAADQQLLSQRIQINALRQRVESGDNRRRAELASAQESFVQQLADKDRTYALAIEVFRNGVSDIAGTPEGLAALAKFNSGDQVDAIAILDRLRAAHDQAREKRSQIESAAEGRRIALLAYDAWGRGALRIDAIIPRFEEVNRLDPAVSSSWSILANLYLDAGRLTDAERADEAAASTAKTLPETATALRLQTNIRFMEGDTNGALDASTRYLATIQDIARQNSTNVDAQLDLSTALATHAGELRAGGNAAQAQVDDDAAIKIVSDIAFSSGASARWQGIYQTQLASRSVTLSSLGDFEDADALLQAALAIALRQSDAQPTNPNARAWVGTLLNDLANVKLSRGDLDRAAADFEQSISDVTGATTQDPLLQGSQRASGYDELSLANIEISKGQFVAAQAHLTSVLQKFKALAAVDNKDYLDRGTVAFALFTQSIVPDSGVTLADAMREYDVISAIYQLTAVEARNDAELHAIVAKGAADWKALWPMYVQQLGDLRLDAGETADAARYYQLALVGARRLAIEHPGSPELQKAILMCDQRLDEIHRKGQAAVLAAAAHRPGSVASSSSAPIELKGSLGILTVDMSDEFASAAGTPGMTGVVVVDVRDGSLAQSAGVKVGDVLTAINGEKVSGGLELRASVAKLTPGGPIALQLQRSGLMVDLAATF